MYLLWAFAGLFAGFFIAILFINKRIDDKLTSTSVVETLKKEIEDIIAGCNEVTDRNITLIEDRLSVVRKVAEQMDKKLIILKTACDDAELIIKEFRELDIKKSAAYFANNNSNGVVRHTDTSPIKPDNDELVVDFKGISSNSPYKQQPMKASPSVDAPDDLDIKIASSDIINSSSKIEKKEVSQSKSAAENDFRQRVLDLYREGYSPSYIAKETGRSVGEIDFIISLEKTLFDKT